MKMKLIAMKCEQNGHAMYLACVPLRLLADTNRVRPEIWDMKANPEGYQRLLEPARGKQFKEYFEKGGFSPVSIMLNVREKVTFSEGKDGIGTLNVPDSATMRVVDGQHRIAGFLLLGEERENADSMSIPVIITNEPDVDIEVEQFLTINRTQVGVPTDLAYEQMFKMDRIAKQRGSGSLSKRVLTGSEWIPMAIRIMETLSQEAPWKNRIRFATENRKASAGKLRSKTMADSLKPIILNDTLAAITNDAEKWADILANYWQAIAKLMPDAFGSPSQYVVQSRTGTFLFHRLFPTVAEYCRDGDNYEFTEERFEDVLAGLDFLKANKWSKADRKLGTPAAPYANMGTSEGSYKLALRDMRDALVVKHSRTEKLKFKV